MTIFRIFKKKPPAKTPVQTGKTKTRKEKTKKIEKKTGKKAAAQVEAKPVEKMAEAPQKPSRKKTGQAGTILKSAHITEKAGLLADRNQYVFKVFATANKPEIKRAVEEIYGVDVLQVKTIKIPRKPRRLGRTTGWKKGYKKAIVSIKKEQKIEILPR